MIRMFSEAVVCGAFLLAVVPCGGRLTIPDTLNQEDHQESL